MNFDPIEEAIFYAASELEDPAARGAFLDHSCAGDLELKGRIEKLLVAARKADDFLQDDPFALEADKEVAASEPPSASGEWIGRYKLLEKLGEGGFGLVYVAEQRQPVKRRVALKIIKLGMDTRQVVARFETERQALAMMDHPNIAKVFDAGATETGRPYFVMELVHGVPITRHCEENHLPIVDRLKLFILVCRAIQHAHQKGIIHRDIKPSNILITSHDGAPIPKVIDFGIAKAIEGDLTARTIYTQHHQFIGTPAYMSPEQAEFSALGVDTRTDIYGLGVLLYELLTGTTPFDARELLDSGIDQMRRTIREKEPIRPSTRISRLQGLAWSMAGRGSRRAENADPGTLQPPEAFRTAANESIALVKGDLDWIVMKCLEKDRARRYETAIGLALDLERYFKDEPISAAAPTASYKLRKFVRRNRTAVVVASTTGALLLTGLAVSTALAIWASKAESLATRLKDEVVQSNIKLQEQLAVTTRERTRADAEKTLAQRHLYIARLNLAQRAVERNDLGTARQILDQTADFVERGFEWFYLQREADNALRMLRGHTSLIWTASFSPDGQRVVTAAGDVKIWDAASARELVALQERTAHVPAVAWSPDGGWIASGSFDRNVRIWDASTYKELKLIQTESGVRSLAISSDGNRLALGYFDGYAAIYDIPEERFLCKVAIGPDEVGSICFSPNGGQFAAAAGSKVFKTWNADTGEEAGSFPAHQGPVRFLAWSPDGRRIVSGGDLSDLQMWEPATGKELFSSFDPGGSVWSVAFSSSSQEIAVARADGNLRIQRASDGLALCNLKTAGSAFALCFSPNGQQIVAGMGQDAAVWRLAGFFAPSLRLSHAESTRQSQSSATVTPQSAVCLAFSQDSKEIITGGRDRVAKVWETATGRQLFTLEGHEGAVTSVSFSPDGSRILTRCDPGFLRVWDKASQRQITKVGGVPFAPFSFSPSGTGVVGIQGANAVIWDSSTGAELWRADNDLNVAVPFSHGRRLLTGGASGMARIWDMDTKQVVRTLHGDEGALWSLAISPDGGRIATGSVDGSALVWDSESGQVLHRLHGHTGPIWSIQFSGEGKRIVTGSGDQTTRLWDIETGLELLSLAGQTDIRAAISPNGRYVASLDKENVRLWIAASPEEACAWESDQQVSRR